MEFVEVGVADLGATDLVGLSFAGPGAGAFAAAFVAIAARCGEPVDEREFETHCRAGCHWRVASLASVFEKHWRLKAAASGTPAYNGANGGTVPAPDHVLERPKWPECRIVFANQRLWLVGWPLTLVGWHLKLVGW